MDGNWDIRENKQNSMEIRIKEMRDDLEVWSCLTRLTGRERVDKMIFSVDNGKLYYGNS